MQSKMDQVVYASVGQPRLMSALSALFGALAGLLAMVGIYGVTSYNVRRQRHEFGIRLPLGADPATVKKLVIWRGLITSAAGIALGAIGAFFLTRTLQTLLNDVTPNDPEVYAGGGDHRRPRLASRLLSAGTGRRPRRSDGRSSRQLGSSRGVRSRFSDRQHLLRGLVRKSRSDPTSRSKSKHSVFRG